MGKFTVRKHELNGATIWQMRLTALTGMDYGANYAVPSRQLRGNHTAERMYAALALLKWRRRLRATVKEEDNAYIALYSNRHSASVSTYIALYGLSTPD